MCKHITGQVRKWLNLSDYMQEKKLSINAFMGIETNRMKSTVSHIIFPKQYSLQEEWKDKTQHEAWIRSY